MNQISSILRRLEPAEFSQSIDLLQYAFYFKAPDQTYSRLERNFKNESVWGVFENGNLRSQLLTLDFDIHLNGHGVRAGGISRVSSYPESRNRGNVSRLIDHALRDLKNRNISVALLVPFNVAFYRRFGWELVNDYAHVRIDAALLPKWQKPSPGRVVREEPSAELATEIYRDYATVYNGTIQRTPYWWREVTRPRKDGTSAIHYDADDNAAGYVVYTFRDLQDRETYQQLRGKRELVVHELVYRNQTSKRALWDFLASHSTMIDTISLTLPLGDSLPFELPHPALEEKRIPHVMGRIVDIARFIEEYRFAATERIIEFDIEIDDSRAEWNAGLWRITIAADGKARAEKPATPSTLALRTDIGALTALLFGYQRPRVLAKTERLIADETVLADLEAVIPHVSPYTPDFF